MDRKIIFLGDIVDRGPKIVDSLKIVMSMVNTETAYCLPGNHDMKLLRFLKGNPVKLDHGLEETTDQLKSESTEYIKSVKRFFDNMGSHYVLNEGNLVVSHAGILEEMHGRSSKEEKHFCLYGDPTGELDDFGLPGRNDWAKKYQGKALVVYGHTPVKEPKFHNNTINIDTGCVFGGRLTALRYPELELVSVPARKEYCESMKFNSKKKVYY